VVTKLLKVPIEGAVRIYLTTPQIFDHGGSGQKSARVTYGVPYADF